MCRKTACDSFFKTSLEAELDGRAVKGLVVAGCMTQFCVDTTCRRAASPRGLEARFIERTQGKMLKRALLRARSNRGFLSRPRRFGKSLLVSTAEGALFRKP